MRFGCGGGLGLDVALAEGISGPESVGRLDSLLRGVSLRFTADVEAWLKIDGAREEEEANDRFDIDDAVPLVKTVPASEAELTDALDNVIHRWITGADNPRKARYSGGKW